MTAPEVAGSKEKNTLETSIPGVIISDLDAAALPQLKKMFEQNDDHFTNGGFGTEALYEMIENELTEDQPSDNRRMGIWLAEKLVGYASVVPSDEHEVEIAVAVDKDHARMKIGSAVNRAVAVRELKNGNDVIGEIETRNNKSNGMVAKLGYDEVWYDPTQGRNVYRTRSTSEAALMRRLGF